MKCSVKASVFEWITECELYVAVVFAVTKVSIMKELNLALQNVLEYVTLDAGRFGIFSLNEFGEIYRSGRRDLRHIVIVARPKLPSDHLKAFENEVRKQLKDVIDPKGDRVGNGLVDLMGGVRNTTVPRFAKSIIFAGATIGVERAVQVLDEWVKGEPLRYKVSALLIGAEVKDPIHLKEGIEVSKLPPSDRDVEMLLPPFISESLHYQDYLGATILHIECQAKPVLYKPLNHGKNTIKCERAWVDGEIPGLSVGTFCDALSLACNNSIRPKAFWDDYGEMYVFNNGAYRGPSTTDNSRYERSIPLTQTNMELARSIHLSLHPKESGNAQLKLATRRWINARSMCSSFSDRLIELRIALEALYLNDVNDELKFRLSTRGAWHLGADINERRKFYENLGRVYSLASSAIHASNIKHNSKNQDLLESGLEMCREGILKQLRESDAPDWTNLVLGDIKQ